MAGVAHLVGEGKRREAGSYVVLGSLVAPALATAATGVLCALAEPLLRIVAPPGMRDDVVRIALGAQCVLCRAARRRPRHPTGCRARARGRNTTHISRSLARSPSLSRGREGARADAATGSRRTRAL